MLENGHRRFVRRRHLWASLVAVIAVLSAASATGAATVWPTFHGSNTRTGFDANEAPLIPLSRAWEAVLDDSVYGQPVYDAGRAIAATENDTVYALDPHDGHQLWSVHLGSPVPMSIIHQHTAAYCAAASDPIGITSTPAIDPRTHVVYAVGEILGPQQIPMWQLIGLDVYTGHQVMTATVTPPGANPFLEFQRASLAVANGRLYIGFGSISDCDGTDGSLFHGYLASVTESSRPAATDLRVFQVTHATDGGGVWMPGGPSVSADGTVYVATGNPGSGGVAGEYGDSVIALGGLLRVKDTFSDNTTGAADEDLGSTTPALLGHGLLFQTGKQHIGYLLRANNLSAGPLAQIPLCTGQAVTPPSEGNAFGADAWDGSHLYVPCDDGIQEININTTTRTMTLGWKGPAVTPGSPVIADGLIWSVTWPQNELYALDPTTGQPAPGFPVPVATDAAAPHFTSPAIVSGLILSGTGLGVVAFAGPAGTPADVTPTFTADTPPATATAGSPYQYQFKATGSPPPAFALAGGAFPPGLSLNSRTGILSGRPRTGSFSFSVAATAGVGLVTNTPTLTVLVSP